MKKLLALIISIALILACCITINAVTPTKAASTGVAGLTWDETNSEWILENATINLSASEKIAFSENTTIVVKGTNVINVAGDTAIETDYNITIKGDGKLSILTTSDNANNGYCGIHAKDITLDGPTLVMTVTSANNSGNKAIHASSGTLDVKSGQLIIDIPDALTNAKSVKASSFVISGGYLDTYVSVDNPSPAPTVSNADDQALLSNESGVVKFPYQEGGIEYKMTTPENTTWEKGSGKDFVLRSEAPLSKFKTTTLYLLNDDGSVKETYELVAGKDYAATSGSTVITYKATYLETLPAGKYTAEIESVDGQATTTIVINETPLADNGDKEATTSVVTTPVENETTVANTADTSMTATFVALASFSALGLGYLKKRED